MLNFKLPINPFNVLPIYLIADLYKIVIFKMKFLQDGAHKFSYFFSLPFDGFRIIYNNTTLADSICVRFHFCVSRLGIGWKVFSCFSRCLDLVALIVYGSRNVCCIGCTSSCLVYQFCCSVLRNERRFNPLNTELNPICQ